MWILFARNNETCKLHAIFIQLRAIQEQLRAIPQSCKQFRAIPRHIILPQPHDLSEV